MNKVYYFVEYLQNKDFQLLKHVETGSFDNYYIDLSNDIIFVRVSRDRGFESIDVSRVDVKDEIFDLVLIKKMLLNEKNFNQIESFEILVDFFIENFSRITKIFEQTKYKKTEQLLGALKECKINQMFPEDKRYPCPFDIHTCPHPCPAGLQGPNPPVRVPLKTRLEIMRFEEKLAQTTNFYAPFKAIYEQFLDDLSKSEINLDDLSESEIKEIKNYEYILRQLNQ